MCETPDPLPRVQQLLADVLALMTRVIANKRTWKATPEDIELLSRVSGSY
jgi:hypothetical protein